MQIKRKEGSTVTYKDDKITISGDTFKLEGTLSTTQLMSLYSSGKGRTVITFTVEVPDQSKNTKKVLQDYITEMAEKGLTEEQIMKTEILVAE